MPVSKKYTVCNPRNIREGLPIISYQDRSWFEGDVFVKPVTLSEDDVEAWVANGLLMPTTRRTASDGTS